MNETTITGDGTIQLNKPKWWSTSILYVSALGGATVEIQAHGTTISTLTGEQQLRVDHGSECELSLVTTGYTADITIAAYRL